jgi:hypothetical protein
MGTVSIVNGVEFQMGWRYKTNPTTAKDLTGFSVLVQIRSHKESNTILASYDQDSPEITFTPISGAVDLFLPPSITRSFTFKKGVIDCWVYNDVDTDGDRSVAYDVIIDQGVSRVDIV